MLKRFKNKEDIGIIITMIILMILIAVEFGGMIYYKTKWKEEQQKNAVVDKN